MYHGSSKPAKERVYKTGDLGRFAVDGSGSVEILGRKEDNQVKLNGLRIELGEIENAMVACKSLVARRFAVAKVSLDEKPTLAAFFEVPVGND